MSRKPSIVRLVKIIQRFLIIISFIKLNEAIEVLYSFTSASYIDSNIASRHTQFYDKNKMEIDKFGVNTTPKKTSGSNLFFLTTALLIDHFCS